MDNDALRQILRSVGPSGLVSPNFAAWNRGDLSRWRFSRNMTPVLGQTVSRSGLIALTITPSIWGHGEILPAIVLAFILQGRERLAGIVPILVVWAVAISVLSALARKRNLG